MSSPRRINFVYDNLKARLLSGEFQFGERLEVNKLAELMGTSRQPVLEALKRLQADGFVEITPQVGSRVVIPSPEEINDLFRVCAVIEGLATRLAAERHEKRDLLELAPTVDLVLRAQDGDEFDLAVYLAGNRRFHGTVHQLARSPEVAAAANRYWDRLDFLISSMNLGQLLLTMERAANDHREIFDAIQARDGDRAERLLHDHVRAFAPGIEARLREVLQENGLRDAG